MAKDLQNILQAVGFDAKEATLYLAGLELGAAAASDYAAKTRLNRITVYNALEDMVKRGYFTVVKNVRAKWYQPVEPDYIAVEATKHAAALEKAIPTLRSLQNDESSRAGVRFFQGTEGVKHVYQNALSARSEILQYIDTSKRAQQWNEHQAFRLQRIERGIFLRALVADDVQGKKMKGKDRKKLQEIRTVRDASYVSQNEMLIYDDTVAIITFGKDEQSTYGILISSKEAAALQRQVFEVVWQLAISN